MISGSPTQAPRRECVIAVAAEQPITDFFWKALGWQHADINVSNNTG